MPKKVKPSAFMSFVMEYKRKEERAGYRMNVQQATKSAGNIWQNMSMDQRAPYEIMAKNTVLTDKPVEKFNSQRQPISLVEMQQKREEQRKSDMEAEITTIVEEAFLNNTIGSQEFFFIHGNYFCQDSQKEYVPAELAISKYTLAEGSIKKFHTYLSLEKLPMGFQFDAKLISEESHRLPLPPHAMGEHNWPKLLKQIYAFLDGSPTQVPALYTEDKQLPIISSFFRTFCYEANEETEFRIYPLGNLFYALKQESCKYSLDEDNGFQSIHIAKAIVQRDEYDYRSGIACDFHEEHDASKFCSLSAVMRWGYLFSEYISPNVGIDNVPGIHVPAPEEPKFDEVSVVSRRSVNSKFSYCQPTKVKEIDTDTEFTVSDEKYKKTDDNFPPLGNAHKKSNGSVSEFNTDNDGESIYSAWETARRKQQSPRAPSEASFKFSQSARGRGLLLNPASVANSTATSSTQGPGRSVGRGKLLQKLN